MPIRIVRLTRAGPQPCAAASLPAVDSNHDHPRPERGVLPVGPAGIGTGGASRTRMPRGLGPRGLPVASLPPGAPPGARTPSPWIKSPVLHPYSSRRAERHAGVEPAFSAWKAGTLAVVLMPHVWPGGIEPPISCSQSTRLATRLWPVRGPPRTRTGNLLLAGELLLPIGASSPRGCPFLGDGQPEQAVTPAHTSARGSTCLVPLCSAVQLSTRRHVHPSVVLRMDGRNRTCNRWIWRPALFLVELRPYVHEHENRPPGLSLRAASGRCLHLYPEASPATRVRHGCKNAGMPRCLTSRSRG